LKDADLKELEISRGNRRKILQATLALKAKARGRAPPPPPPLDIPSASAPAPPPPTLTLSRAPSVVTPPRSPLCPRDRIDSECAICMDASIEVRIVGCGHAMCSACAAAWFARTPAGSQTE